MIIPKHAIQRANERVSVDPEECKALVIQSLTAINTASPEMFDLEAHTVDVVDSVLHIVICLHLSEHRVRVQTIGKKGQFWPRPGNIVLRRRIVHQETVVDQIIWQRNDTP